MTSKAKEIEALNMFYSDWLEGCFDSDSFFRIDGLYSNIVDELSHPTLDDAIKVVEEMKNNPNNNFMTMKQVLTALKGLKEGNRRCHTKNL